MTKEPRKFRQIMIATATWEQLKAQAEAKNTSMSALIAALLEAEAQRRQTTEREAVTLH